MYPKLIKPYVTSFCRSICRNEPVWVPLCPIPEKPLNECFSIVPEYVATNGGEQYNGWSIWEWPKVLIEAEFHCVWKNPAGELIDITPKSDPIEKILFLPDPKRKYTGRQVNNFRKALTRDKDIDRFIELADRFFIEMNNAVLADYYGPVIIKGKALAIDDEKEMLERKLRARYMK